MFARKGFTLLELVVVIIIIGILASLGLGQYGKMVEKGKGAEAKMILGQIRSLAAAHYMQYNALTGQTPTTDNFTLDRANIGTADDQIPSGCRETHYFSYSIAPVPTSIIITATRCGAPGRGEAGPAASRTLMLSTQFPAGTDIWGGTGGY